tara:strand:- start:15362 stop:16795 length:1434 start_codon:yes stop_codon:yes gene_type:complete
LGKSKSPIKRIEFLAKMFDVFTEEDLGKMSTNELNDDTIIYNTDASGDETIYAVHDWNKRKLKNENLYVVGKVRVYEDVFVEMVQADPTEHKEYVQWMLTTFVRFIKQDKGTKAIHFSGDDLGKASEYLEIFHTEKHKPKFKALCKRNKAFKDITDPSNINQYRDLSQLYDAVDPYIIRNPSKLEKDVRISAKLGNGVIPYEDRKMIVFIPKNIKASRLFSKYSSWCTTSNSETFNSYRRDKTSKNGKSDLYIMIPKTFLLAEDDPERTDEIYQLHFERRMYMNRSDRTIDNMSEFFDVNIGLGQYFYDELISFARANHKNYQKNRYVDALKKFGFTDLMFDVLPIETKNVHLINESISNLEGINKFKDVYVLSLRDCKIVDVHSNIGDLVKLNILSLPNNKIKKLPSSIGKLKNLTVINVSGNPIKELPEAIKELDTSNGGSLEYFSYGKNQLSDKLVEQLEEWLPNATLNEFSKL